MLAFRQFDTNNAATQSYLGLSPPSKKPNVSLDVDSDMIFKPGSPQDSSGFKFDIQSVDCAGGLKSSVLKKHASSASKAV